jgi:hypothetical protein
MSDHTTQDELASLTITEIIEAALPFTFRRDVHRSKKKLIEAAAASLEPVNSQLKAAVQHKRPTRRWRKGGRFTKCQTQGS